MHAVLEQMLAAAVLLVSALFMVCSPASNMGLVSYAISLSGPVVGEGTHFPVHLPAVVPLHALAAPRHSFLAVPAVHYCNRDEVGIELGSTLAVGRGADT